MLRTAAAALLLLAGGVCLRFAMRRPSSNFAVVSGLCLALAAWAWPTALAATPLLAAPVFDRRWPLRARVHLAGSGFVGLGLLLAPWALFRG